jgi:hypothetical protein
MELLMPSSDGFRTRRGSVETPGYPCAQRLEYPLDERKGVTRIRCGSSVIRNRSGALVGVFEGNAQAHSLDASCGALGKDLWRLSAPPMPQNEKGST